jgi:hypothetical protein
VMIGVRGMKLFCLTSRVRDDVAGSVRWRDRGVRINLL